MWPGYVAEREKSLVEVKCTLNDTMTGQETVQRDMCIIVQKVDCASGGFFLNTRCKL